MSTRLIAMATATAALSCTATFAPPMRSSHFGAPGHLAPSQFEVSAAMTNHSDLSAVGGYQFNDNLSLDVAGDFGKVWKIASLGARWTHPDFSTLGKYPLSGDIEFGGGGGSGGQLLCSTAVANPDNEECAAPDARDWQDRRAYGGYVGFGAGITMKSLRPFARVRAQLSKTTNVPTTLWWSTAAGAQLIVDLFSLYAAFGAGGYTNDTEEKKDFLVELGIALKFGGRN